VRLTLFRLILAAAAVAAVATEVLLGRLVTPPDAGSAVLGGLWLAMPYLGAAGLAGLTRRHTPALVTLLVALVVAGGVGLFLLDASATQEEAARRQVETAVRPGEDPDRGPAAARQVGADLGATVSGAFSILLCVFLPPLQLTAVTVPTVIAWVVSALFRRRPEEGRAPTAASAWGDAGGPPPGA
jgi:hypothetical protein